MQVLKRISYPLSWMESLGTEKEGQTMPSQVPSSAPPGGQQQQQQWPPGEEAKQGMFSNVFNMSNVSNMLTR